MTDNGAGKHMSPLQSGQEDKRGREGGIGIWKRRRRRRLLKKERKKRQKKVDRFLDEWESTVVHEQENRDSFFGPLDRQINTPKQTPGLESESCPSLCALLNGPGIPYR